MGLDLVELFMTTEERLDISIPDEDLMHIRSVGHLYDYVMEKRCGHPMTGCATQVAFYRLWCALESVLGIDPRSVHPSSSVAQLVPRRSRRHTWRLLHRELALELPPLMQSDGVMPGYFLLGCALVAVAAVVLAVITESLRAIGLGALAVTVIALVGYMFSTRLSTLPGHSHQTVGGLAKGVVSFNYEAFSAPGPSAEQNDEIWEAVCKIVSHTLGVKRERIGRASRFIEDLGAC